MISATIAGRLGQDAELKVTQGGVTVCSFSVACDYYANKEKKTEWVRCSMFGKRGEAIHSFLTKGKPVAARGSLVVRQYEHNGEKRVSVDLNVDDVTMLGGREDGAGASSGGPNNGSNTARGAGRAQPQPHADDGFGSGQDEIPF